MFHLHICLCTSCVPSVCGGQKVASNTLVLEFWVIMSQGGSLTAEPSLQVQRRLYYEAFLSHELK